MSLEEKQIWTVRDFARVMGISHWRARELLKRLDEELGGILLRKSRGENRQFTFFSAALLKAKPEVLERVRDLSSRVNILEERSDDAEQRMDRISSQVGWCTREIERIKQVG